MSACLWVRDATRRGQDPERFRCHRTGAVFCDPCWRQFFTGTTPAPVPTRRTP